MKRLILLAMVAVASIGMPSLGATCTWIQTDATTAQAWSEAANWQDGNVPSAGDDVVISSAANINFAGATVGSITASAALTIDCGGGTLTVNGNVTGTTLTIQNTTVSLPAGEHVWSTSGAFYYGSGKITVYFVGEGTFVKAGEGKMQQSARWSTAQKLFQVPVIVRGGTLETTQYGAIFSGVTELVVDGAGANVSVQQKGMLGSVKTVKLLNSGVLSVSGVNSIEKLYIDGKECAAGTWGAWNSKAVDYKSLQLAAYDSRPDASYVTVTSTEGTYTADDFRLFTGNTRVWTGAANTTWTDAGNWQDGKVPNMWDDIVISADAVNAPKIVHGNSGPWGYYHSMTDNKGVSVSGRLYLSGDFTAKGGKVSVYTVLSFVGEGEHTIENDAEIAMTWHSSVVGEHLNSEGNLTKRGTGKISLNTASGPVVVAGKLQIEEGEICGNAALDIQATNIVVTGSSSVLTLKGVSIADTENTVIRLEKGGKINLNGSFTQQVGKLFMEGISQKKGRTYGSTSSAAEKKEDTAFVGAGLLEPLYDERGMAFIIRIR